MATLNPFDLLDDDAEDPTELLALQQQKAAAQAPAQAQAKKAPAQVQPPAKSSTMLPSKPLLPAQSLRESRNESQRGGRGAGRIDRGGRGFNRDMGNNENALNTNGFSGGYNKPLEGGDASKAPYERRPYNGPRGGGGGFRGGRRGEFSNRETDEGGERPRRTYDRHSGSGRGNEFIKREGAGHGNWGTPTDDIVSGTEVIVNEEKTVDSEKQSGRDDDAFDANKESPVKEEEDKEKEQEEKEMTLEEYEKVREEKRRALLALKSEERKVNLDKELEAMQLLSKNNDEIFAKLGSDKDKRKEAADKAKRSSVSINEFLKPAEGENFRAGGRSRGRGHGRGGGFGGNNTSNNVQITPTIEDVGQFPSLGGK